MANDQSVRTNEDTPVAIALTASDLDNDPLTYSIVSNPSHGTLSGTAPNLTYTPGADYYGIDSFTFRAYDGTAYSNIATVSITLIGDDISDKPVKVTSPNWEWVMKSGQKWTITWKTYMTVRPVANSYLYYTKNGGVTWKLIAICPENPEWYTWIVPSVATKKTNCKVKVVLKDADGIKVGKDVSDKSFTIKP